MIQFSKNNFFECSKEEYAGKAVNIVLIDKRATITGELLKQYQYRCPQTLEALKEQLAGTVNLKLGSCFLKNHTLFIVAREDYRQKWRMEIFDKIWSVLRNQLEAKYTKIKFAEKDYPWIIQVLSKYDAASSSNIIVYERCGWEF